MFRCVSNHISGDTVFEDSLDGLGLSLTDELRMVETETGKHFENFHTNNERYNAVRKEAVHAAVRAKVNEHAVAEGMQHSFICGDGTQIQESKPEGPHVAILTTNIEELREKEDVIILVGEHSQDLGLFAYRSLLRHGGMNESSAVGLVKKINQAFKDEEVIPRVSESSQGGGKRANKTITVPGLIILNPGQLYFSHIHKTSMTMTTWRDRRRERVTDDIHSIDDEHNRLQGHKSSEQHVETFYKHILPQLVKGDANLYLIGIADGATSIIECLDRPSVIDDDHNLKAVCFIQPVTSSVSNSVLEQIFAEHGRSWISSDKPKGTLIQVPQLASRSMKWGSMSYNTDSTIYTPPSTTGDSGECDHSLVDETASDATTIIPGPVSEVDEGENHEPVLCPTFSCGIVDVTELIFPAVMDAAVDFILGRVEHVHAHAHDTSSGISTLSTPHSDGVFAGRRRTISAPAHRVGMGGEDVPIADDDAHMEVAKLSSSED